MYLANISGGGLKIADFEIVWSGGSLVGDRGSIGVTGKSVRGGAKPTFEGGGALRTWGGG